MIQETKLYEVLIRFDAGAFQGAHAVDLTRIVDLLGNEMMAKAEVARPLTLEELKLLVATL